MGRKLIYLIFFVLVVVTTSSQADLIHHWKLDEGSGTTAADSVGGLDGTLSGDTDWVAGKIGSALSFDGNADRVTTNDNLTPPEPGTIVFWMWLPSTATASKYRILGVGGNYETFVRGNGEIKNELFDGGSSTTGTGAGAVEDDTWVHVGLTYDYDAAGPSTTVEIYLNGALHTSGNADVPEVPTPAPFVMGNRDTTRTSEFYPGLLDDVQIYDQVLTADQIKYLYENPGAAISVKLPKASAPSPADGATDIRPDVVLTWKPGAYVEGLSPKHKVFISENFEDVNNGIGGNQQDVERYPISGTLSLHLGKTYYWRVDEANDTAGWDEGDIWRFTVANCLVVDDFEDYNNFVPDRIFDTWVDGWKIPTNGSQVGYANPPFAEQSIVHSGRQSMPFSYNNSGQANLSEALANIDDLKSGRDWTAYEVKALSLWFRGYPAYLGSFVEEPAGTSTMTAGGADIAGSSDQFHFAYKEVAGASAIQAKVLSVSNTHGWAKAGVMIRNSLDADSAHAMVVVTPANGVAMQHRDVTGGGSSTVGQETGVTAPLWVRLERTIGGLMRGFYSPDGTNWTQLGTLATITMHTPTYIGMALTSHNVNEQCVAEFSDVSFPNTSVAAQWTDQDIGITSNQAEPMYVAISNANGTTGVVSHDDPNATLINTWTEWTIELKEFSNQGVNLADVDKMAIGFGNKDNPQPGGAGTMLFDDIRLCPPRCVPDKIALKADLTNDCVVDFADLEMVANDWLMGDFTRPGPLLAHYKFDEGGGTVAADSSGVGNDGVFSGTATWGPGRGGGFAAAFDGGVGEVRGANSYLNGLSALSFGAWIKSDVVGTDAGVIIFTNPDGTDQRDIRYDLAGSVGGGTNLIKYGVATEEGSHENESASNVQTTDWQHVMVTWASGEAAKLYINGVLDTPTAEDDIIGGTTTGYTTVIVGRGGKDTSGGWDGLVDDVRVYEVALTAAQVQTVMNGGDLPVVDVYVPLVSVTNLHDAEPQNQKKVNFNDFAIVAEQWMQEQLWPEW